MEKKIYLTDEEARHLLHDLDLVVEHLESKALYVKKKKEQLENKFNEFSE
jgi:hypothetical protein